MRLSRQGRATAKQLISNTRFSTNDGLMFVTVRLERVVSPHYFAQYIETDGVLFFTRILPFSVNGRHFFGLASGKTDMRGDILETLCVKKTWLYLAEKLGPLLW